MNLNTISSIMLSNKRFLTQYTEVDQIGFSSFGCVFKVKSNQDSQIYAVKKIPFKSDDKDLLLKEVNFLRSLSYEFVVKFFEFWNEENYYQYMNLEDGPLSSIFEGMMTDPKKPYLMHIKLEYCPLTLDKLINFIDWNNLYYYIMSELLRELILCVNYLHSLQPPIIHRDLKPTNILLSYGENGKFVKLNDFGLSTIHENENQSHTANAGTLQYIAPEVARSRDYNTKADIWSLGVIFQDMFKIDFKRTNQIDIFPDKNLYLENLLLNKMMLYKANDRPSCAELLIELSTFWLGDYEIDGIFNNQNQPQPLLTDSLSNEDCFLQLFLSKKLPRK